MAIPEGLLSQAWVAWWAVVVPTLFGLGVVRALGLGAGAGRAAAWAFAYLVGHFVLAHGTAAWLWLGQPFGGLTVPVAGLGVGSWLLWRARRRGGEPAAAGSRLVAVVIGLLVLLVLREAVFTNAAPVRYSDEAQIWAAKAKALYGGPAVGLGLGLTVVEHADYPNFNPLVQVLAFAASGRVLHFENRLPLQCFSIALLLLLAAACRDRVRPLVTCLVLVACAGTLATGQAMAAYADVPLACASLAMAEALLRWRAGGERVWWRLACLAAAAMLATKNEGAMLVLAIGGPAVAWWWWTAGPRLPRREGVWLAVPASTVLLHQLWNRVHGLRNDLLDPALAGGRGLFARLFDQAPTHGPTVLEFFARLAIEPGPHRLLPLLFVAAALLAWIASGRRWWREPAALLLASVLAAIAGYMLVFVGTHADLAWHLATAAARTVEHVVPIAALGLAMLLGPVAGSDRGPARPD